MIDIMQCHSDPADFDQTCLAEAMLSLLICCAAARQRFLYSTGAVDTELQLAGQHSDAAASA